MSEMKQAEDDAYTGVHCVDNLNLRQLQNSVITNSGCGLHEPVEKRKRALSRLEDIKLTLDHIDRVLQGTYTILTESLDVGTTMHEGPVEDNMVTRMENVVDVTGSEVEEKYMGSIPRSLSGQKETLDIQKFFARPIEIFKSPILLGNNLDTFLRVWDLYTLNPPVRAKLRNYAYLKGNLHVRVAVTGTPFHMGKLLLSYQPYDKANGTITNYLIALSFNNDLRYNFMCYLSQAPGACTIDMKDNQPVDLICPFISTKPMHRLFNSATTAISTSTSFDDLYDAGCLYIMTLNTPDTVTDNSAQLSMYVYAWMTDVELGPPTATIVGITTESKDERRKGPVEEISTNAAALSRSLARIPIIKEYALASSQVFKKMSEFSAHYGWSKPCVDYKPNIIKNMPYQNGCNAIGFDTSQKLSIDPHQELTVDPSVTGSVEDEMSIAHICSRESLFRTFTWADTSTPMNTNLFVVEVHPFMISLTSHGAPLRYFIQPTALAYASQLFNFWRGDITYRFDIVCSSFHRGKLLFYYEPNIFQNVLIDANLSLNKQFIKIVDIQETQSVKFCVKWNSYRQWLRTSTTEQTNNVVPTTPGTFNGYIGVMPLTRLTSPLEKSISINVYVSSDNMQFNLLSPLGVPTERKIVTESLDVHPIGVTCFDLNESTAVMDYINLDHFGENPVSFRTVLKRFVSGSAVTLTTASTAPTRNTFAFNRIPVNAVSYSTAPVANAQCDFISYFRYAYLGLRGSTRLRFRVVGTLGNDQNFFVSVRNSSPASSFAADSAVSTNTASSNVATMAGSVFFAMQSNPGVEVDIPMYTNNLFLFSFSDTLDGTGTLATDDMELYFPRQISIEFNSDTTSKSISGRADYAAGEDFCFLRFMGAPYYSHT